MDNITVCIGGRSINRYSHLESHLAVLSKVWFTYVL